MLGIRDYKEKSLLSMISVGGQSKHKHEIIIQCDKCSNKHRVFRSSKKEAHSLGWGTSEKSSGWSETGADS